MITTQAAIDTATEEGFTISTDYLISDGPCRMRKRVFYVKHKASGLVVAVRQVHGGSKTWDVNGDRGTRAQMIIEAMRKTKKHLNESWEGA